MVTIEVSEHCDEKARKSIIENLVSDNTSKAEAENYRGLSILAREASSEDVVAGLFGYTHWRWLFISQLWVSHAHRGHGLGKTLMVRAESEALERECFAAHLDTFDFQAVGFHRKFGYQEFAQLDDFPLGHTRYLLKKQLVKSLPDG